MAAQNPRLGSRGARGSATQTLGVFLKGASCCRSHTLDDRPFNHPRRAGSDGTAQSRENSATREGPRADRRAAPTPSPDDPRPLIPDTRVGVCGVGKKGPRRLVVALWPSSSPSRSLFVLDPAPTLSPATASETLPEGPLRVRSRRTPRGGGLTDVTTVRAWVRRRTESPCRTRLGSAAFNSAAAAFPRHGP